MKIYPPHKNLLRKLANDEKLWLFEEARKVIKRYENGPKDKDYILFETGYGPSGLPHIGTFGEVFRTTMVQGAVQILSDIPSKLICFSDDLDGLRKVPDNVPNTDLLKQHLQKPLSEVPDPFEKYDSFGAHNNAQLCAFLDQFQFEYEFISATNMYKSGAFNDMLLKILENYDAIMDIMLPTLGEDRRATYSPFLPICPTTRHVLQVPILERDVKNGRIIYQAANGEKVETLVTDGHCKLQWKADWGMRWVALGVDYEMSGKDLIDSVTQSSKIARAIGGHPPEGFSYELFLDEAGQKISKSKGNGLTMEEWLSYAPEESLAYFMFQKPKTAKRLFFDVIPKNVDEYLSHAKNACEWQKLLENDAPIDDDILKKILQNPPFHIHQGALPFVDLPLNFSMLLNLVGASDASDKAVLWGFIQKYCPTATAEQYPILDKLVQYALKYYNDFILPTKEYSTLSGNDLKAVQHLQFALQGAFKAGGDDANADALQNIVFAVGRDFHYDPMRDWFQVLYQGLLGQKQGPRMGGLFALLGEDESLKLLKNAIGRGQG